jgi:hypothetical protein
MTMKNAIVTALASLSAAATASAQNWVTYSNQTGSRLVASASLIGADNLEKDFGWGDLDQDGDVDLVCMRKFPGSIQGGFRNILFMNEGGVLVDRTNEYGSASDISGYSGLLDPTNDRDVEVVDVNLDGWLDLITATTMSDQVNSILGQPRVYINLGDDADGNWRGLRFEVDRIPDLFARNGNVANPRFCDAAVGDFNGDGYPDVFYTDYDTPETSGTICYDINGDGDTNDAGECQQSPAENSTLDYDNKLLLNRGAVNPGVFYDATTSVLSSAQINSGFGNMAVAGDFNSDGKDDIVRINTLTTGQAVSIYTKSATGAGFSLKDIAFGQPYHGDKADLNNDGRLDLVIVDDGQDKYLLNTGNAANGEPNFTSYTIADSLSEFGNSTQCGDLDKDGRVDVIITDVDADLGPFCPQSTGASHSRRTHIYRNVFAGSPSGILDEITSPSLVIPASELDWWTDVAVFDINGDTYLDLVAGTCTGIVVYINVPPINVTFSFPDGRPATAVPGSTTSFRVRTTIAGGGSIVAGSAKLWWKVDSGAWQSQAMPSLGGNDWQASLPPFACGNQVSWYVSAQLSNGGSAVYSDPSAGQAGPSAISVQTGTANAVAVDFEGVTSDWTVTNEGGLTTGAWVVATPTGTTSGIYAAAPNADVSASGTKAFVTQNGSGTANTLDVDVGTTRLTSPSYDLSGAVDGIVSFWAWYFCSDAPPAGSVPAEVDPLVVQVSNDGGATWLPLTTITTYPNPNSWVRHTFSLRSALPSLSANVRFRFSISDSPDNSITEAGLDELTVTVITCETPCPGDLSNDGNVDGADLGQMLSAWASGPGNPADLNADGTVDGVDLGLLLSAWGTCP